MPGIMIVYLLSCGVLTGALHLANRYKKPFRIRQCLTISALALVSLQCYPLIASGEEYGRYSYRDYASTPAFDEPHTLAGTSEFEKELVQSIYASCYHSQRVSIENYGVPENLIMAYCSCASKHMYGRLSYEDFKLLQKVQSTGTPPPHEIQQKMEFVAKMCRKSSIDKTSPTDLEAMDQISNQNTEER
jgi:hypothetical protein